MAEPSAAGAIENPSEAASEDPKPGASPAVALRDKLVKDLVAKGKERDKAKAEGKPAEKPAPAKKPKEPSAKSEPKPEPKPDPKEKEADDKPEDDEEAEEPKLKAEKRALAKATRKIQGREAAVADRESKVTAFETRLTHEAGLFEKDPIAWLKGRKVDIKKVLLDYAKEDGEDPRDKKLREIAEKQAKLDEAEAKRQKAADEHAARQQIVSNLVASFEANLDVEENYPALAKLDPARIGAAGAQLMVEHFLKTGRELDPSAVFDTLEEGLRQHQAKANGAKSPRPPDQDRSVAKSKPESPEAQRKVVPARDVTNRTARSSSAESMPGGRSNLDRNAIRDRLKGIVSEHVRSS